jgi:hypothetical protein
MGAALVVAARSHARQSVGVRPLPHSRGRHADTRARYVRALLSKDFGAKAASYVDTFMDVIRWNNVERLLVQTAESQGTGGATGQ